MTKEYEKLEPTFKAKWITALLSGKYVQGRHAFRSCDNKYCCLGVAADIIDPTSWISQGDRRVWEMLEMVGLSMEAQHHLMELNDDELANFPFIAAWIEEYL